MFQFSGFALPGLCIQPGVISYYADWVAPFGDLRITAYLPLPEAYRSFATSFLA